VSTVAANIPFMLYNQAPLSFLDGDSDVSMAADLFDWTYRRSLTRYNVVSESPGFARPFRIKYRDALNEAVCMVVRGRQPMTEALAVLGLPDEDAGKFHKRPGSTRDALSFCVWPQIYNQIRSRTPEYPASQNSERFWDSGFCFAIQPRRCVVENTIFTIEDGVTFKI
jgi:hypothetical protein